jgi:hypothetical protein
MHTDPAERSVGNGAERTAVEPTAGANAGPAAHLKDHALLYLIACCGVTAAATWAVQEKVRVAPMEYELKKAQEREAEQRTRETEAETKRKDREKADLAALELAPKIKDVTLVRTLENGLEVWHQNIAFTDADGDANFVNYIVLQSSQPVSVSSASIEASAAAQKSGTTTIGRWNCGQETYSVKFRVLITDAAGRASNHHDYPVNCNQSRS